MPDPPDTKREPIELPPQRRIADIGYAELHCKTNFSFLEGASHPDELVVRASELGYEALAITDRSTLAGVVRAHGVAKQSGIKLLIGAELAPTDAPPVVVLATDRAAYGRLCRLLTLGRRNAPKGECHFSFDDLAAHGDGLIACVLETNERHDLGRYRELFDDRCYLLAELHLGQDDESKLQQRVRIADESGVPLAAANGVHFHVAERRPLADILVAIRNGTTVADATGLLFANAERYLKSPVEMQRLFSLAPAAISATVEISGRCTFSLDELRYQYPEELVPDGVTALEHLTRLTWAGAKTRYPNGIPDTVQRQIEHELTLITELRYEAYFLTVWDLVRFARSRGILCQGRGSAANSVVCFCLGVTSVDPERIDVLFERFISKERGEAPDIDVDFEHERREEVLQYIYEKYGRDRAAMTAEVITYRPRSAVRDVGKALGISLDTVDAVAKSLDSHKALEPRRCSAAGLDPRSDIGRKLLYFVGELLGFPRHLGQHVGGMVMTQGPLCEMVPIENAAMEGRTVIEWDKDDLDELGILKVDCLSLGMLTAIHKCFDLVERHHGTSLSLATIPEGDQGVYDMICDADTMGVFQIESRAQMSMLPRLRPRRFYDLVIEVAIVRPGPIQGDMVHPYLRRRASGEDVTYPNDEIRAVLEKTLGVPLFQEQAMKLAVVAAGFTPGEADQLRRAMAAWRRPGVIEAFHVKLIEGMKANGLSEHFAENVYRQIRGFGEYGFPESHAASFALLVYVSAYLKYHYPAAFCVSLLNSQPMGFYAPAQLIQNARDHGVTIRPTDVNHSRWDSTLEGGAIRLGLRMIVGMPHAQALQMEQAREVESFRSIEEFTRRTGVRADVVKRLANADAFGSLKLDRRQSLWQSLVPPDESPLFGGVDDAEPLVSLPPMSPQSEVFADYRATGLSLKAHPVSFFREQLRTLKVVAADALQSICDGTFVRVAGIVLVRQRPGTAKGITFVTLEDETGVANLIIRMDVWEKFYKVARTAAGYIASGRLQNQQGVIHVLVTKLEDLNAVVGGLRPQSRDFH